MVVAMGLYSTRGESGPLDQCEFEMIGCAYLEHRLLLCSAISFFALVHLNALLR